MNDGDQALNLVYLIGCLVLVASGLLVRRAPIGQTLKMALAWVLIFAAAFAIFALRDDFRALGRRIMGEATGEAGQEIRGGELRIRASEDVIGAPRTRIVGLSANAFDEDREACLAAGMDAFLVKPIDPEKLAAILAHPSMRSILAA